MFPPSTSSESNLKNNKWTIIIQKLQYIMQRYQMATRPTLRTVGV